MIEYQNICEAYLEADGVLSAKASRARSTAGQARWNKKRHFNDQAYFIMLFAQLEDKINRLCKSLITKKKGLAKWGMRRSWDIIDLDGFENRFNFMNKVALLLDKALVDYGIIKKYYAIRCKIAHGNVSAVGTIIIPNIMVDLKNISLKLRG